ncbi:MAG: alpha/beta hydrolase [Sedimentitalea sp.]
MRHLILTSLLCLALSWAPIARAQDDPGLAGLTSLATSDPAAAIDWIVAWNARTAGDAERSPHLTFDVNQLQAELLVDAGRALEAATVLVDLANYVNQQRTVLDVDPSPLWAQAARQFEAASTQAAEPDDAVELLENALEALQFLLEEQRDGARSGAILGQTLEDMARLSTAIGDAPEADRLLAQAASARAAPAMEPTRGSTGGFHAVDVFYATDRARTGRSDPAEFYGMGRGELELGVATVTIPHTHSPGVLEAPSIWKLEFRANPARHVVLARIEPFDSKAYFERLKGEVLQTSEREAFVFIHGYNVRFEKAARRAAQLAYDMNYTGVPILYSWPSRGSTVGYVADTAVVRLSGRRLSRFLDDLVERSGAQTIHIVAHSMGNRALTDALELMALRRGVKSGDDPLFGQVLFAAPDVDAGLFREMLPTIRPIAERLTLYASEEDWALTASRKLHGDVPRAGLGGRFTLVDPSIDSIDMSELGEDMLSHSYFADDSSALADIMTLFWQNTAPQHRCGLAGRAKQQGQVWSYRSGVCADRNLIDVLGHMRKANVRTMDQARIVLDQTVSDAGLAKRLENVVSQIVNN